MVQIEHQHQLHDTRKHREHEIIPVEQPHTAKQPCSHDSELEQYVRLSTNGTRYSALLYASPNTHSVRVNSENKQLPN